MVYWTELDNGGIKSIHTNMTKIEHTVECAYTCIRPIFSVQFLSDLLFIPYHHCPVQSECFYLLV